MSTLNVNNENKTEFPNMSVPIPSTSKDLDLSLGMELDQQNSSGSRQRPIRASRARVSLSNDLKKIKKRTIMRPNKKKVNLENVADLYLKQKVEKNFKPSLLETIQEDDEEEAGDNNIVNFTAARKIKRSLSCSDGLNYTKKTINKRRNKIKKTFGRRYALKVTRISLDVFLDRLNASFDETTTKCDE